MAASVCRAADFGLAGGTDLRWQREVVRQELGLCLQSARVLGGEVAGGRVQTVDAPGSDPVSRAGDGQFAPSSSDPLFVPITTGRSATTDATADQAMATTKPMASATTHGRPPCDAHA